MAGVPAQEILIYLVLGWDEAWAADIFKSFPSVPNETKVENCWLGATQSVVHGLVVSASPGSLSWMQDLRPHSRLLEDNSSPAESHAWFKFEKHWLGVLLPLL